ncbi:MAG TPA: zf-HC2 domain-containing protein [Bryobacteraceae bacterium]|nr:zf-HC2 domain-containing protein [Bryobacteraceae bacterium]
MSCAEYELLIALYVEGDLPAGEADAIEAHLESCHRCREVAAELGESQAALKALRADSVENQVFQDIRREVLRRLPATRATVVWPKYAIAATLVMALFAGWLWHLRPAASLPAASLEVRPIAPLISAPPVAPARAQQAVASLPRLRKHHRHTVPAFKSEPLLVKMLTDDPQVVIYWLIDQNGG